MLEVKAVMLEVRAVMLEVRAGLLPERFGTVGAPIGPAMPTKTAIVAFRGRPGAPDSAACQR